MPYGVRLAKSGVRLASSFASTTNSRRKLGSSKNVPIGNRDAKNATPAHQIGHFRENAAHINSTTYSKNSPPCNPPMTRFGSGIPARYFSGMPTQTSSMNEQPSISAIRRNFPSGVGGKAFSYTNWPSLRNFS